MRAPTLKDVAQKAGVGIATASTVVNGGSQATRVSSATRQRILEAAAELRYHPNAMARGLRRRKSHTVGVLFDSESPFVITHNPHASAILEGILTTGREHGYHVLTFTSPWNDTKSSSATVGNQMTDGVLIVAPRRESDVVSGLKQIGVPMVVASAPSTDPNVPSVDVDHREGARLVAEHLVSLGHRRIAFFCSNPAVWASYLREEAFWRYLSAHGIPFQPKYRIFGSFDLREAGEGARQLLDRPEPPTAIFAMNDQLALCLIAVAREMGIRVPEDLSVVGFDDIPLCEYVAPRLTTIHHPMVEVGRRATEILLQTLDGEPPEMTRIELPATLVERGTTAPAK